MGRIVEQITRGKTKKYGSQNRKEEDYPLFAWEGFQDLFIFTYLLEFFFV